MTDLAPNQEGDDGGLGASFDPDAIDRGLKPICWGRYEDSASPQFRSAGVARLGSLLLAGVVAVGVVRWIRHVPSFATEASSLWWRSTQVGLAAVGIVSALVVLGLLVRFALTGRLTSWELGIRSDLIARAGSGVMGLVLAVGSVAWAWRADWLFNQKQGWYRWMQLVLAVVGIAAACVAIVYAVRIAVTGRTWRRWREVMLTFGIVAGLWTLNFWLFATS